MERIKNGYYFMFYTLYSRGKKSATIFPYDFIASLYIIILEILIIVSLTNYYNIIFKTDSGILSNEIWILIVITLTLIDYFLLYSKNQFKFIVRKFDYFSNEKNKRNKQVVYAIIILIIMNLIFSFYLLSQLAKQNQTGSYAPEVIKKERKEDSLQKTQQIEKLKKIYGEDKNDN
ncbi:hypothetical protein VUJ46_02520 [Chryseobacterium sp. MYb264]|uniref:hypothetical protein n=1 Tax=Chryseobacterium sp. MYb264 TaxID=2745153 RepID=UPI002E1666D5|nr:hypothetical protein VUJ46_02520 [Chryseobacterium sp. MYb264]